MYEYGMGNYIIALFDKADRNKGSKKYVCERRKKKKYVRDTMKILVVSFKKNKRIEYK